MKQLTPVRAAARITGYVLFVIALVVTFAVSYHSAAPFFLLAGTLMLASSITREPPKRD
jgi:hypothetical protein